MPNFFQNRKVYFYLNNAANTIFQYNSYKWDFTIERNKNEATMLQNVGWRKKIGGVMMAKTLYVATTLITLGFILYFYGIIPFVVIISIFLILFAPVIYFISKNKNTSSNIRK